MRNSSEPIVAPAVGQQQCLLVHDAHEAGRIAPRRAVEALRPDGRDHHEGRFFDERPVVL
jgi:hypothetical protein